MIEMISQIENTKWIFDLEQHLVDKKWSECND